MHIVQPSPPSCLAARCGTAATCHQSYKCIGVCSPFSSRVPLRRAHATQIMKSVDQSARRPIVIKRKRTCQACSGPREPKATEESTGVGSMPDDKRRSTNSRVAIIRRCLSSCQGLLFVIRFALPTPYQDGIHGSALATATLHLLTPEPPCSGNGINYRAFMPRSVWLHSGIYKAASCGRVTE